MAAQLQERMERIDTEVLRSEAPQPSKVLA